MARTSKNRDADNSGLDLIPALPKSFFKQLLTFAEEFGMAPSVFAREALKHYAQELRRRTSPMVEALGANLEKKFVEARRRVSQNWWSQLSPEERKARAKKARDARGKKQKDE